MQLERSFGVTMKSLSDDHTDTNRHSLSDVYAHFWGIVSTILGVLVILFAYVSDAITYSWIENHNMVPDLNNPMDWALGIVGVLLIIGGISAFVVGHRQRGTRGSHDGVQERSGELVK